LPAIVHRPGRFWDRDDQLLHLLGQLALLVDQPAQRGLVDTLGSLGSCQYLRSRLGGVLSPLGPFDALAHRCRFHLQNIGQHRGLPALDAGGHQRGVEHRVIGRLQGA
jgi:hypothetical protein